MRRNCLPAGWRKIHFRKAKRLPLSISPDTDMNPLMPPEGSWNCMFHFAHSSWLFHNLRGLKSIPSSPAWLNCVPCLKLLLNYFFPGRLKQTKSFKPKSALHLVQERSPLSVAEVQRGHCAPNVGCESSTKWTLPFREMLRNSLTVSQQKATWISQTQYVLCWDVDRR